MLRNLEQETQIIILSTAIPDKVLEVTLSLVDGLLDRDTLDKYIQNRFEDTAIVYAGSAFEKGAIGTWRADYINEFVLYKAADMLSRGINIKIYDVFRNLNQETQIILMSATTTDKVLEVSSRFMRDHIWIMIKKEEQTLEGIHQFYISVKGEEWKQAALCDL